MLSPLSLIVSERDNPVCPSFSTWPVPGRRVSLLPKQGKAARPPPCHNMLPQARREDTGEKLYACNSLWSQAYISQPVFLLDIHRQVLAGCEFYHFSGRNLNFFPGLRVAAGNLAIPLAGRMTSSNLLPYTVRPKKMSSKKMVSRFFKDLSLDAPFS
jgi:hypothetical protein